MKLVRVLFMVLGFALPLCANQQNDLQKQGFAKEKIIRVSVNQSDALKPSIAEHLFYLMDPQIQETLSSEALITLIKLAFLSIVGTAIGFALGAIGYHLVRKTEVHERSLADPYIAYVSGLLSGLGAGSWHLMSTVGFESVKTLFIDGLSRWIIGSILSLLVAYGSSLDRGMFENRLKKLFLIISLAAFSGVVCRLYEDLKITLLINKLANE